MVSFVQDAISTGYNLESFLYINETTPHGILGVSKGAFKIARDLNLGFNKLSLFKKLCQAEPNLTENLFRKIDTHLSSSHGGILTDIKEDFGISVSKSMDYLERCYMYQCIPYQQSVILWRDYLNMAEQLHYTMDKQTRYPNSLKKAHDIASFQLQFIRKEKQMNNFSHAAEKNRKYCYTGKTYTVLIPDTPDDLVKESNALHHCVHSYVDRVANRDTVIAFIRDKNSETEPLYTAEIKDGQLIQIRGSYNCIPKSTGLQSFLNEWCKEKNIINSYN